MCAKEYCVLAVMTTEGRLREAKQRDFDHYSCNKEGIRASICCKA